MIIQVSYGFPEGKAEALGKNGMIISHGNQGWVAKGWHKTLYGMEPRFLKILTSRERQIVRYTACHVVPGTGPAEPSSSGSKSSRNGSHILRGSRAWVTDTLFWGRSGGSEFIWSTSGRTGKGESVRRNLINQSDIFKIIMTMSGWLIPKLSISLQCFAKYLHWVRIECYSFSFLHW